MSVYFKGYRIFGTPYTSLAFFLSHHGCIKETSQGNSDVGEKNEILSLQNCFNKHIFIVRGIDSLLKPSIRDVIYICTVA